VAFANEKSGIIVGIGKIGESLSHSIDDVYLVGGLKYNMLNVSQLCDKYSMLNVSQLCDILSKRDILFSTRNECIN